MPSRPMSQGMLKLPSIRSTVGSSQRPEKTP